MNKYTFSRRYAASSVSGMVVTIPDQVADNQRHYDGRSFPVIKPNGSKGRAVLRGDLYGLHTSGTGDALVKIVR